MHPATLACMIKNDVLPANLHGEEPLRTCMGLQACMKRCKSSTAGGEGIHSVVALRRL
jgi:hypothetical protein